MRRVGSLMICACLAIHCSTDTFGGSDGSVDTGSEGASDGGGGPDAKTDGPTIGEAGASDAASTCPFDGGVACGVTKGSCGALGDCCVTTASTTCSSANICAGSSFDCMTQADCGDAGAVCCITQTGTTGCPRSLSGASSQCVMTCTFPGRRACTSNMDCMGGSSTCQTVSVGGLTMGACLGG